MCTYSMFSIESYLKYLRAKIKLESNSLLVCTNVVSKPISDSDMLGLLPYVSILLLGI